MFFYFIFKVSQIAQRPSQPSDQEISLEEISSSLLERKNYVSNIQKARKERYNREFTANKSVTCMLIIVSFMYTFGNTPYAVYYIAKQAFGITPAKMYWLYFTSQCSLYLLVMLKTFVYYAFNRPFREVLNTHMKPVCLGIPALFFKCMWPFVDRRGSSTSSGPSIPTRLESSINSKSTTPCPVCEQA
jgi:hypothetical protein